MASIGMAILDPRGNCNGGSWGESYHGRIGPARWQSLLDSSLPGCVYLGLPCKFPHPTLLPFLHLPHPPGWHGQPFYLQHQFQILHIQNANALLFVATLKIIPGFYPPASSLPVRALLLDSLLLIYRLLHCSFSYPFPLSLICVSSLAGC